MKVKGRFNKNNDLEIHSGKVKTEGVCVDIYKFLQNKLYQYNGFWLTNNIGFIDMNITKFKNKTLKIN